MKELFILQSNERLTADVMKATFEGNTLNIKRSGQFVNVKIDGLYLRRPLSVCDYGENFLTLVYKIVGEGTAKLAEAKKGDVFDMLVGLGNGYDLSQSGNAPLLLGGGVGVPPLYNLAKMLKREGKKVQVVLGFNTKSEVFFEREFADLGVELTVATVDGSYGKKGFVTDCLPSEYTYFYACGPEPMLKAVCKSTRSGGELSFERRMGCGFGACMGCTCATLTGNKRICKEGPVLKKEELLW